MKIQKKNKSETEMQTNENKKKNKARYALRSNWKFQLACKQAQVTIGSQWLALPMNTSLLVKLPSFLQGRAGLQ
jgi:hypothetical protein